MGISLVWIVLHWFTATNWERPCAVRHLKPVKLCVFLSFCSTNTARPRWSYNGREHNFGFRKPDVDVDASEERTGNTWSADWYQQRICICWAALVERKSRSSAVPWQLADTTRTRWESSDSELRKEYLYNGVCTEYICCYKILPYSGWPLVWETWKCRGIWNMLGKCRGENLVTEKCPKTVH